MDWLLPDYPCVISAGDRVGSGMTHGHACRMIHHALCYTLTNLAPDDNIRLLLLS